MSLYGVAVQWLQETLELPLDGTETAMQLRAHQREQLDARPRAEQQQLDGEGMVQ